MPKLIKEPYVLEKTTPKRSCNRHYDCDKADREAKEKGAACASHCHDECCEECFGY